MIILCWIVVFVFVISATFRTIGQLLSQTSDKVTPELADERSIRSAAIEDAWKYPLHTPAEVLTDKGMSKVISYPIIVECKPASRIWGKRCKTAKMEEFMRVTQMGQPVQLLIDLKEEANKIPYTTSAKAEWFDLNDDYTYWILLRFYQGGEIHDYLFGDNTEENLSDRPYRTYDELVRATEIAKDRLRQEKQVNKSKRLLFKVR